MNTDQKDQTNNSYNDCLNCEFYKANEDTSDSHCFIFQEEIMFKCNYFKTKNKE